MRTIFEAELTQLGEDLVAMSRLVENAITNAGTALLTGDVALAEQVIAADRAVDALERDLDELTAYETEPGLGNGGLGRLAACFIDSLAAKSIPAIVTRRHLETCTAIDISTFCQGSVRRCHAKPALQAVHDVAETLQKHGMT